MDHIGIKELSRTFVVVAGLLVLLYASLMSRDITEPIQGLHSWAQAHVSWLARSHVEYGLEYTRGLNTWAVGTPPPEFPDRYLDHPQLPTLLNAVSLSIFGVNDWAQRLGALIVSALFIPFLMLVLRHLFGETTAILATLIYILFPISGYFYWIGAWIFTISVLTIWSYAKVLDELGAQGRVLSLHLLSLFTALFLMVQVDWAGFLYAAVIGIHYVLASFFDRNLFNWKVFFTLLVAPFLSLFLVMIVLIAARDWNLGEMIELYKWRSSLAGDASRTVSAWWANYFNMMKNNYSLPVLILSSLYIIIFVGNLVKIRITKLKLSEKVDQPDYEHPNGNSGVRRFRMVWVFLMPGILYSAVFSEAMWVHHYQYAYYALFLAISAALFILYIRDLTRKRFPRFAEFVLGSLVLTIFAYSIVGLNRYYEVEWYAPEKVSMFKALNKQMPPSQKLLSFESYTIMNNPAKGAHYRPEVAWHLNREIRVEHDLQRIEQYASTRQYRYYLMSDTRAPLFRELKARYPYRYIQGRSYQPMKVAMPSYHIFDLWRANQQ